MAEPDVGDEGMWSAPQGGRPDLREQARSAWIMALVAIVLGLVNPCLSGVTLFATLPFGLVALSRARRVLSADPDEATAVYARTARILGIASAIYGGVGVVLFVMIFGLYALMFAMGIISQGT